jgi:alkyl hydroperoxide reductase subunit F
MSYNLVQMNNVTIYTTKTCPFCKMEREYLNSKGVKFEEIFVDHDMVRAREMIKLSGQMGVPFTVVVKHNGEKVEILGFDQPKIDEVLGL